MNVEEIKQDIEKNLSGVTVEVEGEALIVPAEKLLDVAGFLKENEKYRLDYVSCITAVDYLDKGYLESVSNLFSIEKKSPLQVTLKVRVPRDNPKMPSLTPLYRGAEYQEREAYDLFGIIYEGHNDLRRILMWDEFEGHPMRKDYIQEDQHI